MKAGTVQTMRIDVFNANKAVILSVHDHEGTDLLISLDADQAAELGDHLSDCARLIRRQSREK